MTRRVYTIDLEIDESRPLDTRVRIRLCGVAQDYTFTQSRSNVGGALTWAWQQITAQVPRAELTAAAPLAAVSDRVAPPVHGAPSGETWKSAFWQSAERLRDDLTPEQLDDLDTYLLGLDLDGEQ